MTPPSKIPDIEGLQTEANECYRVLTEETNDLACVLLSLAFLDLCLASLIKKFFIDSQTAKNLLSHRGPIGTFHSRADLAYSLGLISKGVLQNLQTLGDMRNEFAHSHLALSFDDDGVNKACKKLTLPVATHNSVDAQSGKSIKSNKWPEHLTSTPRMRFVLIVSLLASDLMGAVFSTEKREKKERGWTPQPE